ncbi:hypothetical protein MHLP_02750 [Candidatus Mycoplasma haematolamae str. Purdue]|uniref:Uncharacterized protein n=1 Tax=Mycoplasma haematolamae (strain Purdue) TaxID=1212765 RepID=I7BA16_MYCHA|nr:hypothetical protein [Candidatus Mycoplasma haematolamae]AFO52130.1 hypothetical protein MHLP_02750 [Candidatus Mycoplasma haematolamae str. Purdue]
MNPLIAKVAASSLVLGGAGFGGTYVAQTYELVSWLQKEQVVLEDKAACSTTQKDSQKVYKYKEYYYATGEFKTLRTCVP